MPRGSIRHMRSGTWLLRWEAPRSADGKRRQCQKTFHGTRREAEAELARLMEAGIAQLTQQRP